MRERAGLRLRRVLRDPATGVRTAPLCFASRSVLKMTSGSPFPSSAYTRAVRRHGRTLTSLCRSTSSMSRRPSKTASTVTRSSSTRYIIR